MKRTRSNSIITSIVDVDIKRAKVLIESKNVQSLKKSVSTYQSICSALENHRRDVADLLIRNDFICSPFKQAHQHNTPLHLAVLKNDVEMVNLLLNKRADINVLNQDQKTPLHIAVKNNRFKVVQKLLKSKPDLSRKYSRFYRRKHQIPFCSVKCELLGTSIANQQNNITNLLICNGCIMDHSDFLQCNSPLHSAVSTKNIPVVKQLLENVNINVLNESGISPLHIAVDMNDYKIFKILQDYKPNWSLKYTSEYGQNYSIFYLAFLKNNEKIISDLMELIEDKWLDNSPLLFAYECKNFKVMQNIFDVEIESVLKIRTEMEETTLLHLAVKRNDENVVDFILKCLYDRDDIVNTFDSAGKTPLYIAFENRNLAIMNKLLFEGADVNILYQIEDIEQHTILFKAIENNDIDSSIILLKEPNKNVVQGSYNLTPLHLAINKGEVYIVKKLLQYGADICFRPPENIAPLELAEANGNEEVLSILKRAKQEVSYHFFQTFLTILSKENSDQPVINFLDSSSFFKIHENAKNYALIEAVKENREIVLEYLINEIKVKINFVDRFGNTPLHYSVTSRHEKVTRLLLNNNAKIEVIDFRGRSPLHCAAKINNKCFPILLDFGANLYLKDKSNTRPLDLIEKELSFYSRHQKNENVLQTYFMKRKILNLYLDKIFYQYIRPLDEKEKTDILNEVQMMKNVQLNDTNLTLYDYVKSVDNTHILSKKIENPLVAISIEKKVTVESFPNYFDSIFISLKKAKARKKLLDKLYLHLNFNLNSYCIDYLLNFLQNEDLQKLIDVYTLRS